MAVTAGGTSWIGRGRFPGGRSRWLLPAQRPAEVRRVQPSQSNLCGRPSSSPARRSSIRREKRRGVRRQALPVPDFRLRVPGGGAAGPEAEPLPLPRLSDSDHGLVLVAVAVAARLLLEAGGAEPRAQLRRPRGTVCAAGCRRRRRCHCRRRPRAGEAGERTPRPDSEVTAPMTAAPRNEWGASCTRDGRGPWGRAGMPPWAGGARRMGPSRGLGAWRPPELTVPHAGL